MASGQTIEQIWPSIEKGLSTVLVDLEKGFPLNEWMNLYSSVYNYCMNGHRPTNHGSSLGEEIYARVTTFLRGYAADVLKGSENRRSGELLVYYRKQWERYTTAMSKVHHIFSYINRVWVKNQIEELDRKDVYGIYTLSLVVWRDSLFHQMKDALKVALLDLMSKERDGEQIDTGLVATTVGAFVQLSTVSLGIKEESLNASLDLYKTHFEDDFLAETEIYYTKESSHFIMVNSVVEYMKKVETRLGEETRRVALYLHDSTLLLLIKRCEQVLIEKHVEVIQSEFGNLLELEKPEDLDRLYNLLNRVNGGLESLRQHFERFVHKVGVAKIEAIATTAIKDPKQYVEELLKIYKRFNDLVVGPFRNDPGFTAAMDKACRRFVNDNEVCRLSKYGRTQKSAKSPELLAKFTDLVLKKSNKGKSEQELEDLMNEVLIIFRYIEEKDVFMKIYSKLLANRLIFNTYSSEDLEKNVIGKLADSDCGYEFTSKLQRMFTDLTLSRDINEKFRSYTTDQENALGLDFNILIAATGSWLVDAPATNFSYPAELQNCVNLFTLFYKRAHEGRKLNWLHNYSKGEMKMKYTTTNKVGYTVQCSTYQMGVLLPFNEQEKLTAKELLLASQLTESVLNNTIRALLKVKVLNIEPKLADEKAVIEPTHVFTLNKLFRTPKGRMKVNIDIRVEDSSSAGQGTADSTLPDVTEERKIMIQAALVRVMKQRKKLKHANLVSEVVMQLQRRFTPQIQLIKRQIDTLIEREYLARVDDEKDTYSYVA